MAAPPRRIEPPFLDPPMSDYPSGQRHSHAWTEYHQSVADRLASLQSVTDGSEAAAGAVGEYVMASGSIGLTPGLAANATVLGLSAGDWDVWGRAEFVPGGGGISQNVAASVSGVSNALSGILTQLPYTSPAGALVALPTGVLRLNLAAAGTAYLVVRAAFTVAAMTCNGVIMARRAR